MHLASKCCPAVTVVLILRTRGNRRQRRAKDETCHHYDARNSSPSSPKAECLRFSFMNRDTSLALQRRSQKNAHQRDGGQLVNILTLSKQRTRDYCRSRARAQLFAMNHQSAAGCRQKQYPLGRWRWKQAILSAAEAPNGIGFMLL